MVPVPVPSWEFPKENLKIERVVGHGAFGVVSKGYARYLQGYSEWTAVAVKSLQGSILWVIMKTTRINQRNWVVSIT